MILQEEEQEQILSFTDGSGRRHCFYTVFSFELPNSPWRYLVMTDGRRDRTGKKKIRLARCGRAAGLEGGWEFSTLEESRALNPLVEITMEQLSRHMN